MSRDQLFNRAVSGESGVNLLKLSSGRFSSEDWERITDAQARLYEMPIYIDDSPGLHYVELRRRARKWISQNNIKILFIDYMQLMQGDKQNGRVAIAKHRNGPTGKIYLNWSKTTTKFYSQSD